MPDTRTAQAAEANRRLAAERAIDDPAKLARAARIVRLALVRNRLTIDDLTDPAIGGGGAAA